MTRKFQAKIKDDQTSKQFWVENQPPQILDLIQETRRQILTLDESERFARAKAHLKQAMQYKNPRIDMFNQQAKWIYRFAYNIQTSFLWGIVIKLLSFVYMYLIIFEKSSWEITSQIFTAIILILFWIDLILQFIHISQDYARRQSKYTGILIMRFIILLLLIIEIGFYWSNCQTSTGRPINPLIVFRSLLPVLYVSQVRRSFQALLSAFDSFTIYVVFQCIVVLAFGLIGSILIDFTQENDGFNVFTANYTDLGHMIFIIYVTGSYDAYPDNQLPALPLKPWLNGSFFVLFIFLNMFIFSSIPGSLLFDKYIKTRSKYILIDEIKMQHSLVLAFVSIGQQNYQIDIKVIIRFFNYLYEDRVRYVDAITQICLLLNDDGNCSVHVLQFIQLGRALQENPSLKFPIMSDIKMWIQFRKIINRKFQFDQFLQGTVLPLILAFLALVTSFIAFYSIYHEDENLSIINIILTYIQLIDILIRFVGIGPENYFNGEWNTLNFSLIIGSCITQLIGFKQISSMLKIIRIYQAFPLFKTCVQNSWIHIQLEMLQKFQDMMSTVMVIMPIISRFLPLFMLVYYILGILGCEIFYNLSRQKGQGYDTVGYLKYSNFQQFLYTQFYLVQVLTEAGWSAVAFDYAARSGNYWSLTLLFFVFCHIVIVLVLAAVLKGIIWFVYISVSQLQQAQKRSILNTQSNEAHLKQQIQQIKSVQDNIKNQKLDKIDSVIKRILFQQKVNLAFLDLISKLNSLGIVSKTTKTLNKFVFNSVQNSNQIKKKKTLDLTKKNNFLFSMLQSISQINQSIYDMEDISDKDIVKHLRKISDIYKLSNKDININIKQNQIFLNHLKNKLFAPFDIEEQKNQEQLAINGSSTNNLLQFSSKKALESYIFSLHLILGIKTDRFQQKFKILEELAQQGLIDQCDSKALMGQKLSNSDFRIDEDSIVRQMYLEGTNQKLIQKFQAEYFSDIYGSEFKEINKITIQPLIKIQTSLTYALKKLARSPHINQIEFFKILTQIQGGISNMLLKQGSLFKFVYQLDCEKDIWFTIHCNCLNQNKISFIKHGLWIYHQQLAQNQIYYGKDIFKIQNNSQNFQQKALIMKKFFQTFQTLALTLNNNDNFFQSNPQYHSYDTFLTYIDVSKFQRIVNRQYQISKIMAVMLTKQNERPQNQPLQYPITDIKITPPEDLIDFNLGQTQSQTYTKLTRLCELNDDQITANEGLPFSYVLNFLCQISDTLKLYASNFVHQAELVLTHSVNQNIREQQDKITQVNL